MGAEKWNSLCGYSWFSVWWGLKPLGHKYPQYAPNQIRQWGRVSLLLQDRCWSRGKLADLCQFIWTHLIPNNIYEPHCAERRGDSSCASQELNWCSVKLHNPAWCLTLWEEIHPLLLEGHRQALGLCRTCLSNYTQPLPHFRAKIHQKMQGNSIDFTTSGIKPLCLSAVE